MSAVLVSGSCATPLDLLKQVRAYLAPHLPNSSFSKIVDDIESRWSAASSVEEKADLIFTEMRKIDPKEVAVLQQILGPQHEATLAEILGELSIGM